MNQTKQEADDRVWSAMRNSLAKNPSLEYLEALKGALSEWMRSVQWLIDDKRRMT